MGLFDFLFGSDGSSTMSCSMLALIPQSGDFSGATLGVRSVALLQVPKPAGNLLITSFELGTIVLSRPMGLNDYFYNKLPKSCTTQNFSLPLQAN